jgi:hypothetical protein
VRENFNKKKAEHSHIPNTMLYLPFTLHSAAVYSSIRRSSLPPSTPPPIALHSAVLHSPPSFRRTDNPPPPRSSSSSSNWTRTATADRLVQLQLPPVMLLIFQLSVERQPATVFASNTTPTDLPLGTFDTRQTTTRRTANEIAPRKGHVVQQRHPQLQPVITDLLRIEPTGESLVGMIPLAPDVFTLNVTIYSPNKTIPHFTPDMCWLSCSCSHQPCSVNCRRSNVPVTHHTSLTTPPFAFHPVVHHCWPSSRHLPLPPFTPPAITLRSDALHPPLPRRSLPPLTPPLPPFIPPLFTPHSLTHHSRRSLRHPSSFIPPHVTLHSRALYSRPS